MTKEQKPSEARIVRDFAAGKVIRVETVLTDGSSRVLYELTPEQREAMEAFLEQPRPATH